MHQLSTTACVLMLVMMFLWACSTLISLYGVYVAFCKKWYLGAVALLVPGFALVIGAAKLLFKKDLLK